MGKLAGKSERLAGAGAGEASLRGLSQYFSSLVANTCDGIKCRYHIFLCIKYETQMMRHIWVASRCSCNRYSCIYIECQMRTRIVVCSLAV